MVDLGRMEARVAELRQQLREAEGELVEARKTEVPFRYRYVLNGRAQEGGYLRVVLPRGVSLRVPPSGWQVAGTPLGRVKLGRVVARDEPHEHVFLCAASRAWVREHQPWVSSSGRASDLADGLTASLTPALPVPAADVAAPTVTTS